MAPTRDEQSTFRRMEAAVGAPEFLDDFEGSTHARRVPGYGMAPYEQQSAHQPRESTERSAHGLAGYSSSGFLDSQHSRSGAPQNGYGAQRDTLEDMPRRRAPRATPVEFAAESASSSRSTAKAAPYSGRAEGSAPKAVPTKPFVDVAPPSPYPAPKVVSPGKAAPKAIVDVAPPSPYPAPKVVSPGKAAPKAVVDVAPLLPYPAPKVVSPGRSDRAAPEPASASAPSAPSQSASSTKDGRHPDKRGQSSRQARPLEQEAAAVVARSSDRDARSSSSSRSSSSRSSSDRDARSASSSASRSSSDREAVEPRSSSSSSSRSRSRSSSSSGSQPLPPPPAAPPMAVANAAAAHAATADAAAERPSAELRPSAEMRPSADMPGMIDPLQVPVPPEMAPSIYSWIRRLALQNDLPTADRVVRDALLELTSSLAVTIIYPGADGLWTLGADDEMPKDTTPIVACAQVRRALITSHSCMIPIVTTTETVGVIILTRNPRNEGYHPLESIAGLGFIREAAAILHHLAINHLQKQSEINADKGSLYRGEALEAHRSRGTEGVMVALSPGWVRRTYPILCLGMLAAVIFALFIKVPTYSSGQAVIMIDGTPVTTPSGGQVSDIRVVSNQKVSKGAIILKLNAQAEEADLKSAVEEEEAFTASYLFDQTDEANKKQLLAAAQKVEALRKRIEQKIVRAPRDGVISDIRARIGEPLQPGEPIVTIVQEGSDVMVTTFLNATDLPRLRKGMPIKVNLAGFTKSPDTATIVEVSSEAFSPESAAKILNPTLAGSLKLAPGASYVLVRAKLPRPTFESQKQTLWYHHGMGAKVDVLINEKPFLVTLIPALEKYVAKVTP